MRPVNCLKKNPVRYDGLVDNIRSLEHTIHKVHDNGYVRLLGCYPGLTPEGLLPENMIAQAARVSTSMGERSLRDDNKLIKRLLHDKHTSPFEMLGFHFDIRTTIEVKRQLDRHRTFKWISQNEFSQRYKEIPKENDPNNTCPIWGKKLEFMRRSNIPNGIRMQGTGNNKQISIYTDNIPSEVRELILEAEHYSERQFRIYHKLCEMGVAREISRSYLPLATYTEFQGWFDMHNLLNFFFLRCDRKHAQSEIADVADAMRWLITPLIPTIIEYYEDQVQNL